MLKEISTISNIMSEWILYFGNQLFLDSDIMNISIEDDSMYIQKFRIDSKLKTILAANPMIRAIYIYDNKDEDIITSAHLDEQQKQEIKDLMTKSYSNYHYRISPRKANYINNTMPISINVLSVMFLNKPKENKNVENVLMLDIPVNYIQEVMNSIKNSKGNSVFIIDTIGTVVSHSNKEMVLKNVMQEEYIKKIVAFGKNEGYFTEKIDSVEYVITYIYSSKLKWYFIEMVPYESIYARNFEIRNIVLIITFVILILETGISILIALKVSSPFEKFIKDLRSYSSSYILAEKKQSKNELEQISNSYLKLVQNIQTLKVKDGQWQMQLKTKVMTDYLINRASYKEDVREVFRNFSIDNYKGKYVVSILRIDNYGSFLGNPKETRDLLRLMLCNIASEIAVVEFRNEVVDMNTDHIALILETDTEWENSRDSLVNIIKKIQAVVEDISGLSVSAGIGSPVTYLNDLYISYERAVEVSNYRLVYGHKVVLLIDEIMHRIKESFNDSLLIQKENEMFEALNLGKSEQVEKCFDSIVCVLGSYSYKTVMMYFYKLYFTTLHLLSSVVGNEDVVTHNNAETEINKLETVEEIKAWFMNLFLEILERLEEKKNNKTYNLIYGVSDYINDNFSNQNLSAELLSEKVSLTPHYFGKVFKKVTGMTYTEYITRLRIEKAKELLVDTNYKINEIGEKCGFTNYSYFVTIFKKNEGITPNTYRSENNNLVR